MGWTRGNGERTTTSELGSGSDGEGTDMDERHRVLIVGGGFAGFHCARRLSRRKDVEVTLLNATDYFLYLPLLPQVTGGLLGASRVAVALASSLPKARLIFATASKLDIEGHSMAYDDGEGHGGTIGYDTLVLAAGSVNKLLPIPGIADHAHGFRGISEALYLREHLIRQVEMAAQTDDPAERASRLTFVVVGAGYTGTEVLVHGQRLVDAVISAYPRLRGEAARWHLVDTADRVLPGLDERLSRTAARVLRRRGVEVHTKTSLAEATADGVRLSDDGELATKTLIWCVGVRPDPFLESTGLPTDHGRVVVNTDLTVPEHPEIYAIGDAAAVPDLTRPGQSTAMTAQHAQRQGIMAARNIVADSNGRARAEYKHHDLGFTVDLAAPAAAADPFGIPLSGPIAAAVTAGYHLLALPGGRLGVAMDWMVGAVTKRRPVQLGLIRGSAVPLDTTRPETPRT
jgi:NADH dehydrogenase